MLTLNNESRFTKVTLYAIMTFVLLLSLSCVLFYGDYFLLGSYAQLNNDDVKYIESAKILTNYHILTYNSGHAPTSFIMPGVPFILSGLMLLFGQNENALLAYRILQAILQSGSIFILFLLARYIFNSRVALIACGISALYLPDYFTAGIILSEMWFKTIFMLLLLFTIIAIEKRLLRYYVGVAILLALACYFKPQAVLYPLVFIIPWLKNKYSWQHMLNSALVVIITFSLLLAPWWARNYISFNKWVPFTSSSSSPLLEGSLIFKQMPSAEFFKEHPQYTQKNILQGSEGNKLTTGKQILIFGLTHEPLKYIAWHTVIKTAMLYISPFYWKNIFGVNYVVMTALHIIMVIMAVIGIVKSYKHRIGRKLVTLLAFTYFTLIYLPFITFDRYGYPNDFILIIFAAFMMERIYGRKLR
jgi:4-amino-4-deoxy-L-arabinose transferase-like glycosyltransferase